MSRKLHPQYPALFAAGLGEVVEASATALSLSEDLPPPDTVVGTVKFASGTPASVSITFAGSVLRFSLSVTGTKGSLEVRLSGCYYILTLCCCTGTRTVLPLCLPNILGSMQRP